MLKDPLLILARRALLQEQWAKSHGVERPEGVSFRIGDRTFAGYPEGQRSAVQIALLSAAGKVRPGSVSDIVIVTPDGADGHPVYPNRAGLRELSRLARVEDANNIRVYSETQAQRLLEQAPA